MSRSESPVLRRSARLISRENRDDQVKLGKDLVLGSEPPRQNRRKLEPEASKRSVYSSGGSSSKKSLGLNSSIDGSSSLRRSLRISSRECLDGSNEKCHRCCSTTPVCTSSSSMRSSNVSSSCSLRRSPRFSNEGGGSVDLKSSSNGNKSGHSVLSRCSKKSVSSERGKGRDGPKPKQMFIGDDDDEEEEVNVFLGERKRMRIENPKADKGKIIGKEEEEGSKTKNELDEGWTEELELALQGASLTVKPSPHFWKKVSKMVPGKSAQECFDRVNSSLITPRQPRPRSRATKSSLSPIPQFSLSASKLNSTKTKIPQRRKKLSKKTIRHLLEKQSHADHGHGFDLFLVLEPGTTSNVLSTPMEKEQSLPQILESPMPCEDQTTVVSPPVLKQVRNKALHEKYIDHLHNREAKRKAASTRLAGKENIRPTDIQSKDSVRTAKDALLFHVHDAVQKLKGIEAEISSGSSEFCYDHSDEDEDGSI